MEIAGRPMARRWLGLAALASMSMALASSCPWTRGDLAPLESADAEVQECPMDDHTATDSLLLPGPLTYVPEFHDCQRFIARKQFLWWKWRGYGALVAIWVRYNLDSISYPLQVGNLGFLVPAQCDSALVVGGQLNCWRNDIPEASAPTETGPPGVAVALVWSDRGYAPLGIRVGYHCLYLSNPSSWTAKMVPVQNQKDCFENVDLATVPGTDLAVHERKFPGRDNQDFPPVARWHQGRRSYNAGIKCLAAWCEIGPKEEFPSYGGGRTREIPGWYDEQHLAVHTASDEQWPTAILGTVFPDPGLDTLTRKPYERKVWAPVAYTMIRPDPEFKAPQADEFATYQEKFNFAPGSGLDVVNRIFFCYGTAVDCFPRSSPPTCGQASGEDRYWARIESATGTTEYRCVTYTDHDLTLPGVVRWRWLKNDDKNWISCPDGCCQVNPE